MSEMSAPPRWRSVAFRAVVVLLITLVVVLFNGAAGLVAPWVVWPDPVDHGYVRTPELHRMADAQASALMVLLCAGALLGIIHRPLERPALLQLWVAVFAGITLTGPLLGDNTDARDGLVDVMVGAAVTLTLLVVLPALLYPAPRTLLRLPSRQRPHPAVAILAGIGAVGLLAWIVATVSWHLSGGVVENVVEDDWMGAVFLGGGLLVALALITVRQPGWGWLAGATVTATVYTGVVSIVLPDAPTGWGPFGGGVGIALGAALGVAAVVASRDATVGTTTRLSAADRR